MKMELRHLPHTHTQNISLARLSRGGACVLSVLRTFLRTIRSIRAHSIRSVLRAPICRRRACVSVWWRWLISIFLHEIKPRRDQKMMSVVVCPAQTDDVSCVGGRTYNAQPCHTHLVHIIIVNGMCVMLRWGIKNNDTNSAQQHATCVSGGKWVCSILSSGRSHTH